MTDKKIYITNNSATNPRKKHVKRNCYHIASKDVREKPLGFYEGWYEFCENCAPDLEEETP